MQPRIEIGTDRKLIGKSMRMTIADDRSPELFKSFMPYRREIKHNIGTDIFCMQIYDLNFDFNSFTPQTEFEKWAAVEVSSFEPVPQGMKAYELKGGLYAVFDYKGKTGNFADTFRYIFYDWLPASIYDIDQREHFDILGDKYKNNDPESEEEIWVPVKLKNVIRY